MEFQIAEMFLKEVPVTQQVSRPLVQARSLLDRCGAIFFFLSHSGIAPSRSKELKPKIKQKMEICPLIWTIYAMQM